MNGRERVFAMIEGRDVDCLPFMPITMQFAADLIEVPYLQYETDFRALVEGQLRAAEEFDLDYVNTMSDPVIEASDCGAVGVFHPNSPAAVDESNPFLSDPSSLTGLGIPGPTSGRMGNRVRAVAELKQRVGNEKMVEGWIEGPCAQAADLRGLSPLMLDLYDEPGFVVDLFEFVLEMELQFARAQVDAGADVIGIGDAAASLIGPRFYREYVWPFEKRMVDAIHGMGAKVRLHICGNTTAILDGMGALGCDIVDLDFLSPVEEGRQEMGADQVILGNIDPVRVLRDGTPGGIYQEVEKCHRAAGKRFIVGPGCEVTRDTSHENLRAMGRYARSRREG